jgi:mycofactocin system glycosyltransferase
MVDVTRFRRDSSWRQPGDRRVVIAGSPLRFFRLSPGAASVLAMAEVGEQPDTEPVQRLIDRFVDAGALHPLPGGGPYGVDDVTVVMPVHGRAPTLPAGLRTIVVDDASAPPLADIAGATTIRLDRNGGPAAARNAGLARVTTPLVVFLDDDVVVPDSEWLAPLLAHFADPRVALVAPRVAGAPGDGHLARYEARHSPLDLGAEPARVAAGTRVSYVPAAALVCRTDAIRALGGFDTDLRVGEDVDLVWRLCDAGQRCRYEPMAVVTHRPRADWAGWWRQRVGYGRSAAPLSRRHRGALAPVRTSAWSVAVWTLVAARRPWLALTVATGTVVALQRKLHDVPARESARLVVLGHLGAGRQFAAAVTRVWWPIALVAGLACRRARLPLGAAVVARICSSRTPIVIADDMAYGAGVWRGMLSERTMAPVAPSITTWPRRGER